MTLHDFKEKYCRKDPEGLYRGKWFIKDGDCVKYTNLESDVLTLLLSEEAKWKEEISGRIGFLRQWLNEKSADRLVTNEDIEEWLGLK